MEEIARQESEGGKYHVVFIEQEDGAGYHTNAEYIEYKNEEFKNRNWLRSMHLNTTSSIWDFYLTYLSFDESPSFYW